MEGYKMNPTPTPFIIDNMPTEFGTNVINMFQHIIQGMKNCIIPFTHITWYQWVIGTIILAIIVKGIKIIYGTSGGGSTKHE